MDLEPFHICFLVDDLERSMPIYAASLGIRWAEVREFEMEATLSSGTEQALSRCTYSIEIPRYEICEANSLAPFASSSVDGWHHVGYWSDDVNADIERLVSQGYEHEMTGRPPEVEQPLMALLRAGNGARIELVHSSAKDFIEEWCSLSVAGG